MVSFLQNKELFYKKLIIMFFSRTNVFNMRKVAQKGKYEA